MKKPLAKRKATPEAPPTSAATASAAPAAKRAKLEGAAAAAAAAAAKKKKTGTAGGATAGSWEKLGSVIGRPTMTYLVEEKGFETMAPVQAAAIPQMLKGKDVVVEAITGSGKTLAYLVPMFETCMAPRVAEVIQESKQNVVGVIILPTRELAIQVEREAAAYSASIKASTGLDIAVNSFIGGREGARDAASYEKKGANVCIGTPGRLYELMVLGLEGVNMACKTVEVLVLDEADRLLSGGFAVQLDAVLQRLPKQRRTGLFSATQTSEVKELVRVGMRNPVVVRVQVKKKETMQSGGKMMQVPETLQSFYRIVKHSGKLEALAHFVLKNPKLKIIAYVLTCSCVEYSVRALRAAVGGELAAAGVDVHPLHGQMALQKRKNLFKQFREGTKGGVLLCTDVAARGLDVADVDWVFQLDAPLDPATYIHRVGRAARMGRKGQAMLYLSPNEASYIDFLKLQKVVVDRAELDDGLDANSDVDSDGDDDDASSSDDEDEGVDAEEAAAAAEAALPLVCGMRHNVQGGVRFRVKVASRGLRQKWKLREKRQKNKGSKKAENVLVGEASKSKFIYNVRKALVNDRDLNDIAAKAFVTWVRAYREHSLRYIFKLGKVDVLDLAHSFALLRYPKMPELQHVTSARIPMEEEFLTVNPKEITCTTEEGEERRQERLKTKAEKEAARTKEMSERNKKREEVKNDQSIGKRRKAELWSKLELDELNDDARLLKKLRQGKITEAEYAKLSGEEDMELAFMSKRERGIYEAKKKKAAAAADEERKLAMQEAGVESSDEEDEEEEEEEEESEDEAGSGSESDAEEAKEQPVPSHPSGLSKSGKAPQAWIEAIKRKIGR